MRTIELGRDLTAYITEYPVDGFELEVCRYGMGDGEPLTPSKRYIGYGLREALETVLAHDPRLSDDEIADMLDIAGIEHWCDECEED